MFDLENGAEFGECHGLGGAICMLQVRRIFLERLVSVRQRIQLSELIVRAKLALETREGKCRTLQTIEIPDQKVLTRVRHRLNPQL